jgi:Ser/Thr protein kinase RdoA (MazF antagonist)
VAARTTHNAVCRLEHFAGFLAGYHGVSPLGSTEVAALPAAIAAGNVLEISYFREISMGMLTRRKLPDHDEALADTTEAAGWHLGNYAEVAASMME